MTRKSEEPYLSTYLHQKGRKLGLPISGTFELTARCNFDCPMCYVHLTPEQLKASGKQELTAHSKGSPGSGHGICAAHRRRTSGAEGFL